MTFTVKFDPNLTKENDWTVYLNFNNKYRKKYNSIEILTFIQDFRIAS